VRAGGTTTLRIIGIGMGLHHVTPEAAEALRGCDYVLAAEKGADDHLLALRREVCAAYDTELVGVPDPARDRRPDADYRRAVADWHQARVAAYAEVLARRPGTVGMLVWGDASLYDSTIRVADALAERGVVTGREVVPGVSAPQLLAARHGIVLHEVGRPVHVTTARRLREAVDQGQDNVVVMLGSGTELDALAPDLADWSIWWGANLGRPEETLVAGRVGDVHTQLVAAREQVRWDAGWVMDVYLLRRP